MARLDASAGKKGGGFVYRTRDPKTIYDLAKRQGGDIKHPFKKQYSLWLPQAGPNTIRVLPPTWADAKHYALTIWVHRYIGPEQESFMCLAKHLKKRCPCCEASKEELAAGNKEEAYNLSAREQRVVWMIDRKAKDSKLNPQLYMFSWKLDQQIAEQIGDEESGGVVWIDHPEKGRDLRIRKTGAGKTGTNYLPALMPNASLLTDRAKEYDAIMNYIMKNPLTDVLKFVPADEMEVALSGTKEAPDALDEEMGDEEEGNDVRRGRKARDSVDEDEEEDPPPRQRAPKRIRDEEEVEEEDERPNRRRARNRDEDDPPRRARGKRDEEEPEPQEDEIPEDELEQADEQDERPSRRQRIRDEDEDEESDPPPRRRKARDEEDGEEEAEVEDAEQEDERPSRRRARDEEEEEDDPPRPRRSEKQDERRARGPASRGHARSRRE